MGIVNVPYLVSLIVFFFFFPFHRNETIMLIGIRNDFIQTGRKPLWKMCLQEA